MTDRTGPTQPAWPANHRAALVAIIHVDASATGTERSDVGIDYTADGLDRLLAMFDDLDVAVTTAWTVTALGRFPQLARAAQDRGHELALSLACSGDATGSPESVAGRISDLPIVGLLESLPGDVSTPAPDPDHGRLDRLQWTVNASGGDVPRLHAAATPFAGPVIIPVSPFWIDHRWWHPERPSPPSLLLESWSAGMASIRTRGGLMTIVLHPDLSGRPGHAETIGRFVDEAIASGDVWLARADQVATWWTRSHE
jgi:hypothetical protein